MKITRRQNMALNIEGGYDLSIGIDNGVSGTMGIICQGKRKTVTDFFKTPVILVPDFQKVESNINRLVTATLGNRLYPYFKHANKARIMMERPFLNPRMFKGSISAARCHEATLIVIDAIINRHPETEFEFVDSKPWQMNQLPSGTKGTVQLKLRSMQYGCRMFPEHSELILKHKDADGLLIANYLRSLHPCG